MGNVKKPCAHMRKVFDTLVGFSAIGREDEMDIAAVALGAVVLEKRLTLSRSLPGHHHILAKEPKEFSAYVATMRDVQASLGAYDLRPSPNDLKERRKAFRHLVANRNLPGGTLLTEKDLEGKRPEFGISPEHLAMFIGRSLKRALKENEAISWSDV